MVLVDSQPCIILAFVTVPMAMANSEEVYLSHPTRVVHFEVNKANLDSKFLICLTKIIDLFLG